MSNDNQAIWQWSVDDEERYQAEQLAASQQRNQQVDDRLLADFDSIFMNEGE